MKTALAYTALSPEEQIKHNIDYFFHSIGIENIGTKISIHYPARQKNVEGTSYDYNRIRILLPTEPNYISVFSTCIHESTHLVQWFLAYNNLSSESVRDMNNKVLNKVLKSHFSSKANITPEGQKLFADFLNQYGFNKDFVDILRYDEENYPRDLFLRNNMTPYYLSASEISANEVAFNYVDKYIKEQQLGISEYTHKQVLPDDVINGLKQWSLINSRKSAEYSKAGFSPTKDFLKQQIRASGHFFTAFWKIKEGLKLNWAQAFDKAQKLCDKFNEREDYLKAVTPLSKHLELEREQKEAETRQREYIRELDIPEIGVAPEDAFETTFGNDTFRSDIDSYNRNTRILGIDLPNHIIYYRGLEEEPDSDDRDIFEENIRGLSEDEYNVSGKDPGFDNDER